jgi:hypothetical protein
MGLEESVTSVGNETANFVGVFGTNAKSGRSPNARDNVNNISKIEKRYYC